MDSGDLFFERPVAPGNLEKSWQMTANFLVDELNDMGMDAMGLGEIDFALGVENLKALEKKAKFHFLCANIVDASNKPLFTPSVILKRNGVRIGIFSVMDSSLPVPAPYKLLNEMDVAREMVAKLKHNADFIIALTHQGLSKDKDFAAKVPGISLMIGGHDSSLIETPLKINEISIVQAGDEGKYVGHVFLTKAGASHQLIPLDASFGDGDAIVFHRVQTLKAELQKVFSEEEAKEEVEATPVHGKRIEVATYRKCQTCHEAQHTVWKTSKHASAILPLYLRNQHLNPECVQCHSVGFRQEGGFKSATQPFELEDGTKKSLEDFLKKLAQIDEKDLPGSLKNTLSKDKEVANAIKAKNFQGMMIDLRDHPEFDQWLRDRYMKEMEKEHLKKDFMGVQCENCHSPRGLFNDDGKSVPHFSESKLFPKKVEEKTCLQCHTPSQSPKFNFAKDRHVKGESGTQPPFQCQRGVF